MSANHPIRAKAAFPKTTPLRTFARQCKYPPMISRTKFTFALSGALFLAACAYVGYANEIMKNVVPALHRVILLIGFIIGAGFVSRWIMEQDYKRNMRRIRQARTSRKNSS